MNEIGIIEFDYDNNVICIYREKEWHDYSISELKDYLNDIQSQLATHKQKEDKLREYIKDCDYIDRECENERVLQILNEGDK